MCLTPGGVIFAGRIFLRFWIFAEFQNHPACRGLPHYCLGLDSRACVQNRGKPALIGGNFLPVSYRLRATLEPCNGVRQHARIGFVTARRKMRVPRYRHTVFCQFAQRPRGIGEDNVETRAQRAE